MKSNWRHRYVVNIGQGGLGNKVFLEQAKRTRIRVATELYPLRTKRKDQLESHSSIRPLRYFLHYCDTLLLAFWKRR